MQKDRFEIWLTNVDRADSDATLVCLCHHGCQHILRFMGNDRYFMVAGASFQDILYAIERFRQRFGIVILRDMQDERFGLSDGSR